MRAGSGASASEWTLFDIVISEKGNAGGGGCGRASNRKPSDADGYAFSGTITDLQAGSSDPECASVPVTITHNAKRRVELQELGASQRSTQPESLILAQNERWRQA